jgi:ribosomal protein S18 acetylase RimI-like enzyme
METKTDVEIVTFDPRFAASFAELNYEWISKVYVIEDHDREILDAPFEFIVQTGGQIFFAVIGDKAVGTVALIRIDDSTFELAKMAVDPGFRGRGIGEALIRTSVEYAAADGALKVVLESNTKQAAALNLYRKYAFVETPLDPNSPYKRANIRMELAISRSNM